MNKNNTSNTGITHNIDVKPIKKLGYDDPCQISRTHNKLPQEIPSDGKSLQHGVSYDDPRQISWTHNKLPQGLPSGDKSLRYGVFYDDPRQISRSHNKLPQEIPSGDKSLRHGVSYDDPRQTSQGADKLSPRIISINTKEKINSTQTAKPVTNVDGRKVHSHLNFGLHLKKRIERVFDTEDGEISSFSYAVQLQVQKRDGKVINFNNVEISAEKIKEPAWLKKASQSLASLPKGKAGLEEFEDLVQACIETEAVPYERIYTTPG